MTALLKHEGVTLFAKALLQVNTELFVVAERHRALLLLQILNSLILAETKRNAKTLFCSFVVLIDRIAADNDLSMPRLKKSAIAK